jgi:hypothetical protein
MSDPKEPQFFRTEYERGLEYYLNTYFRTYSGQKIMGDGAPQHLYLPYVARRIAATVKQPRFAVICRNPVDRIVSHYWSLFSRGVELRPFEEVIELNLKRLAEGPLFETEREARLYADVWRTRGADGLAREFCFYLEPGYYAHFVDLYRSIFGPDQVKVIFFDDLKTDPEGTTNELFSHLGLDPMTLADTRALNEARSVLSNRVISCVSAVPGVRHLPQWVRKSVKQRVIGTFRTRDSIKPPISSAARRQLAEHYRAHNCRLAAITGRTLDHWDAQST